MNFEQKKRKAIEMDKLNIKSHLNTSLEADGITISEDLIRRTMDAIELHEADNTDTSKDNMDIKRSVFFRHTRTLVTVAAAALILVVGLNALRMRSSNEMKSDMDMGETLDYIGDGTSEIYSTTKGEDSVSYNMVDDSKRLESATQDTGAIAEDIEESKKYNEDADRAFEVKADVAEKDTAASLKEGITHKDGYMLAFADITMIGPGEVSSVTISSRTTGDMITISDQLQIDSFYSLMEKHSFTQASEDDMDPLYVVSLVTEDRDSQLLIGEATITVDNTHNDISSQSIYNTADHSMLIMDILGLLGE